MIEQTFIHIPGIGPKTEQKIWNQGIYTWQTFLDRGETIISPIRDDFIAQELGINRSTDIDGIDGFEAVRLWNEYQWGDKNALKTLVEYNSADIVNLKPLMEMGYREMQQRTLCYRILT